MNTSTSRTIILALASIGVCALIAEAVGVQWFFGALAGAIWAAVLCVAKRFVRRPPLREVATELQESAEAAKKELDQAGVKDLDQCFLDQLARFFDALVELKTLAVKGNSDAKFLFDQIPPIESDDMNLSCIGFVLSEAARASRAYLTTSKWREELTIWFFTWLFIIAAFIPSWQRKKGSRPHWTAP